MTSIEKDVSESYPFQRGRSSICKCTKIRGSERSEKKKANHEMNSIHFVALYH